jgi:phage-related minor tail protein
VPKILALATQEVSRQLKIHSSKEQKARFNNRISYERERYDEVKESIENALNMCEITFHGKKI